MIGLGTQNTYINYIHNTILYIYTYNLGLPNYTHPKRQSEPRFVVAI